VSLIISAATEQIDEKVVSNAVDNAHVPQVLTAPATEGLIPGPPTCDTAM